MIWRTIRTRCFHLRSDSKWSDFDFDPGAEIFFFLNSVIWAMPGSQSRPSDQMRERARGAALIAASGAEPLWLVFFLRYLERTSHTHTHKHKDTHSRRVCTINSPQHMRSIKPRARTLETNIRDQNYRPEWITNNRRWSKNNNKYPGPFYSPRGKSPAIQDSHSGNTYREFRLFFPKSFSRYTHCAYSIWQEVRRIQSTAAHETTQQTREPENPPTDHKKE